jgi:uncharacterized protein (TIGR00661 family)
LQQLKDFRGKATVVLGKPDEQVDRTDGNVRVISHLNADELQAEVASAELIISRSGYSTVMDLAAMGKKAVFVPTPGQTEQEYLAKLFDGRKQHVAVKQRNFNLQKAVEKAESYSGFQPQKSTAFKATLDNFVNKL